MTSPTTEQIAQAIFGDRPRIWDAYEQGQLARARGEPKSANHWRHPSLPFHMAISMWDQGWERGVNL